MCIKLLLISQNGKNIFDSMSQGKRSFLPTKHRRATSCRRVAALGEPVSGWSPGSGEGTLSPFTLRADKGQRVNGERLSDSWGQPPWQESSGSERPRLGAPGVCESVRESVLTGQRWLVKRAPDYSLVWRAVAHRYALLFFCVCLTFSR